MDISLSLSTTNSRLPRSPALFSASNAMPALIAPSPITATASPGSPPSSRAIANPSAALIEVLECPAPNGSNELSARLVNPDSPPSMRRVRMRSRRPVRILWG